MLEHHMQEEEKELFPRVNRSDMDLFGMGKKIANLKEQLREEWV